MVALLAAGLVGILLTARKRHTVGLPYPQPTSRERDGARRTPRLHVRTVLNSAMADRLAAQLRWQASACASLGSGFYAALLERLAGDAEAGGPTARVLRGTRTIRSTRSVALRLLGGVHRRVAPGLEPRLARHYPSTAATTTPASAVTVVARRLRGARGRAAGVARTPPETNEVGRRRSARRRALAASSRSRRRRCGSSSGRERRARTSSPIAFASKVPAQPGRSGSPVVFADAWLGNVPSTGPSWTSSSGSAADRDPDRLVDRGGRADADLVRLARPAGAARAAPRRARARRARTRSRSSRRSAADFAADLAPEPGAWTVLWHSVMWQYLDDAERACGPRPPRCAGVGRADDAPLAHLAFEPRRLAPDADPRLRRRANVAGRPERRSAWHRLTGSPSSWA